MDHTQLISPRSKNALHSRYMFATSTVHATISTSLHSLLFHVSIVSYKLTHLQDGCPYAPSHKHDHKNMNEHSATEHIAVEATKCPVFAHSNCPFDPQHPHSFDLSKVKECPAFQVCLLSDFFLTFDTYYFYCRKVLGAPIRYLTKHPCSLHPLPFASLLFTSPYTPM